MSDSNRIQQRIQNRKTILPQTTYTICELADSLNISTEIARKLIKEKEIRSKDISTGNGRKKQYRILGEWIIEYLNKND